jgi:hypothetical protein
MKPFSYSATVLVASLFLSKCYCQSGNGSGPVAHPELYGLATGRFTHHADILSALLDDGMPERAKTMRAELQVTSRDIPRLEQALTKASDSVSHRAPPRQANKNPGDAANQACLEMNETEEQLLASLPKAWSKSQEDRFEELCCQFSGPMALRLRHYAARAEIPEKQRVKIKELVDSYYEKSIPLSAEVFAAPNVEASKAPLARLNALTLALDKKIMETLTEKQKARWQGMLGKRFAHWAKFFQSE